MITLTMLKVCYADNDDGVERMLYPCKKNK